MTDSHEPPLAVESMTASQLGRRSRILDAVLTLVAEDRVDDMLMREVVDRSGVALGTIYRYFSSKDHLVAAALVEWARKLDARVAGLPAPELSKAARLKSLVRDGVRPFQHEPAYAQLMIRAASSTDLNASRCYHELGDIMVGAMAGALPELPEAERIGVVNVIGAVWFTGLTEWVNGRSTVGEVYRRLDEACDLLLGQSADS